MWREEGTHVTVFESDLIARVESAGSESAEAGGAAASGERAIIDIGSNTVRLVIFGGPAAAPVTLHNEKVAARLGKAVAETGALSEKAMRQALEALARYALILRGRGVRDVRCVATAAVRDAANGADFLARVAALGLSPRLLSGEEEAVASARGVMAGFPGAKGVVGDLGGGSLELIDVDGATCTHGISLPLGTLRLPAMRAGGGTRFGRRVRKMMSAADWAGAHGQTLYLVGGSWRALARFAMARSAWPIDDPHGYELAAADALRLSRVVAGRRPGSLRDLITRGGNAARRRAAGVRASAVRAGTPPESEVMPDPHAAGLEIPPARLASLPDAAALLAVLVGVLKPARVVFSAWGLREGLLAGDLGAGAADEGEAGEEPLLAGVQAFVAQAGPAVLANGAAVAAWTAAVLPAEDAGGERTRRAAVLLALASLNAEPNLRVQLAVHWALRKRWIGISAEGRAMLAVAILANSGRTAIPRELSRVASPAQLRQAMAWGLAVRLCRRLSGGVAAMLEGTTLAMDDTLVLRFAPGRKALVNDGVEKDLRLLGECLGLPVAIRRGEPLA